MEIEQNVWGFTSEGEVVVVYKMINTNGAYVTLTNIGAAIVGIGVPDRDGKIEDIALGYDIFDSYFSDGACMGKTAGRYANRIAKGRFTLDGKEYRLATNNGVNHLHGGVKGLAERLWESRVETNRVVFSYFSPDGEERYPGGVGIEAIYDWSDDNELEITYLAKSDAPTILNLTNHVYFNLHGEGNGDILTHKLKLNASQYLPTDSTSIPYGKAEAVAGTPMDFSVSKEIGRDIDADFEPLRFGKGYDHCWVIDNYAKGKMTQAGELYEPISGRKITVITTQPGIQIYTGNYLDGCGIGKLGKEHTSRCGVAMECQLFPDTPNNVDYPSAILRPEDSYEEHIIYKFSVE